MKSETTTRPLRDLVKGFNSGRIQLPQFQRDYVWKARKIRNLLDSLLRGFPIGGFYFWQPSGTEIDAKKRTFGKPKMAGEFTGYLIDGQQRLTSLEAAFGLYSGEDKRGDELRCFIDLLAVDSERRRDTRLFVSYGGNNSIARRVDNADPSLIPLSQLFEGADYELRKRTEEALRTSAGWSAKRVAAALSRLDGAAKMLDPQVPCTTVSDISDVEAVEIFDRLNKGGTQLRQGDVRAAELARGSAVAVLKRMREFASGELPQRLGFGFSFAFRALVVFHRESAQFATLKPDWIDSPGRHGRTLAQSWKATEKALTLALEFIDQRMGWSRRALVPSVNAVIVLAAALDRAEFKTNQVEDQLFRRWLCLTAFRGVFQGSVETTINRFLKALKDHRRSAGRALVDALRRDEGRPIRGEELLQPAQLWGPATLVMHSWLVKEDARDWLEPERSLDALAREGGATPGGQLTVHHTFPRKLLSEVLDDGDLANRPANFAMISGSTNSEFGDSEPLDVLATLNPEQRRAASKQFFGEAAGDRLARDSYDAYCQWRAAKLADSLNGFLGIE